ncbi:peptide ABC transporter ATP-binding protein [Candidatus Magnetomorum sp. HK-1]|nr:peptide ABC transporter ATP-binding protein [Candidatus Magnetomorum sp. HK-1]
MRTILQAQNLSLHYSQLSPLLKKQKNIIRAVNDVSLSIFEGESLGLVGESGCGKSTLGKTLIRFYQPVHGNIYYYQKEKPQANPINIAYMSSGNLKRSGIRQKFQMLLQDHSSAMNPRLTIFKIIAEAIRSRPKRSGLSRREEVLSCLDKVGLNETHLYRYPHEFSGGQRQRICIARTLAMEPEFIVLDEPTSALDVSVQAQILLLLNEIRQKNGITFLFITHNLLVLKYVCTRVAVMYLGKIVEIIDVQNLFTHAKHPYTKILINCVPDIGTTKELQTPKGEIPKPSNLPPGCGFHKRCPHTQEECYQTDPPLKQVSNDHWVSCHQFK